MAIDVGQICRDLEAPNREGRCANLYRCSRGFQTVGVGCRVFDEEQSLGLPWVRTSDGASATERDARVAYRVVSAMRVGLPARAYAVAGGLVISEAEIDALLVDRLQGEFLPGLRRAFPGFDDFPSPAVRAIVDMAFNEGVAGVAHGSPKFAARVRAGDWAAAAAESHRLDCREERNQWVRDMLLAAAKVVDAAPAPVAS